MFSSHILNFIVFSRYFICGSVLCQYGENRPDWGSFVGFAMGACEHRGFQVVGQSLVWWYRISIAAEWPEQRLGGTDEHKQHWASCTGKDLKKWINKKIPTTRGVLTADSWHRQHLHTQQNCLSLLCPSQVLNKRLRAPVHTFVAHLRSVAWPFLSRQSCEQSTAVHFLLKHQGGHLTITLKSELGDVPFYWEFHCTPASVAVVRFI